MNTNFIPNISLPEASRCTSVRWGLILALCCAFSFSVRAATIFVKADATTGDNNGTTWQHAYTDLHTALTNAVSGDVIYVAYGTYKPSKPPYGLVTDDPRDFAFELKVRVSLYGGFAGTEATLGARLFNSEGATILSGDLGSNDGPDFDNRDDNTYHVVTGHNLAQAVGSFPTQYLGVTFDGFTVRGGNADGSGTLKMGSYDFNRTFGGGLYVFNSSNYLTGTVGVNFLTVNNCIFTENLALNGGGAIYTSAVAARYFELRVNKSAFTGNIITGGNTEEAHGGGAIYAVACGLSVQDDSFAGNKALNRLGGAILTFSPPSSPTRSVLNISTSTFTQNEAAQGGAINANSYTTITGLSDCTFTGNKAKSVGDLSGCGGAVICISGGGSPSHNLYHNTFTGNTVEGTGSHGGALVVADNCTVRAIGCIFQDNTAAEGSGGAVVNTGESTSASLHWSVFTGNTARRGGAIYSVGTNSNTLTATSSLFIGNTSTGTDQPHGGAIINSTNSTALISQCTFFGNQATGHDDATGGVLNRDTGNLTMEGNILWNNTGGANAGNPGLVNTSTGTVQVTRNLIQGGFAGEGNIDADPLFVDDSSPIGDDGDWGTVDDGLRLQLASPAVNAALGITVQTVFGFPQVDFSAIKGYLLLVFNDPSLVPRIQQGKPDMGAYENLGFVLATETGVNSAPDVLDAGDWVYYYEEATGELVLAVNSADPSLTTVTGELKAGVSVLSEPFGTEYDEVKVIRRSWSAEGGSFTGTRTVRFFYDPLDLEQLGGETTIGSLATYKVSGSDPYDAGAGQYAQYAITTGQASLTRFRPGVFQGMHYVEFVVNSFSSGSIALLPEGALPVTLVSFTARKQEAGVQLSWKTAEEVNASHFEIERSADAKIWERIGKVKAKGESRMLEAYTFMDQLPGYSITSTNQLIVTSAHPHIYYRLRQLDLDGSYEYSRLVSVIWEKEGREATLYPNPSVDGHLKIQGVKVQAYELLDATGRLLETVRFTQPQRTLQLAPTTSGVYWLRLESADGTIVTRKVIMMQAPR